MQKKMFIAGILLSILEIASQTGVEAEEFKGKVVSVTDGDSITILRDNVREKVILYGVDCPEIGQDFGAQAKQFTDQACFSKQVVVNEHGKDRRGRVIGIVYLPDGSSLNETLVKQGLAWWSDKFAPDDKALKQYQQTAKTQKMGLWAAPNPTPPWIFRNGEKSVQATIKPAQP